MIYIAIGSETITVVVDGSEHVYELKYYGEAVEHVRSVLKEKFDAKVSAELKEFDRLREKYGDT